MDPDYSEVTFRVRTQNIILKSYDDGYNLPLRRWQVELFLLDKDNNEIPTNILSSCTFIIHDSFKNNVHSIRKPPFKLQETGWGEFDIKINCTLAYNAGRFKIIHDLSFEEDAYIEDYSVQIPNYIVGLRNDLIPFYDMPEIIDSYPDYKPSSEITKKILNLDEEEITKFVQIILDDKAVQNEIEKFDRTKPFYTYLGQFPKELLTELESYLDDKANSKKKSHLTL
ncbi:similar to Saccharomyces cerevisiae YPL129W TAF14 Subunit of TFIID [Maudiozyma saulgeensis]|uniref:Similar to Saccharomyces cerevisiae YPL129W TAF14 Subunit of TFIID n=1 Tax=Maudiozyma saulgeensis TaxID=1789683 RepID=A0A1X7R287_9SACH|nr:similar to Saccharomyces cerevisiae YPL129W TAF14 Subunit of TFIID [Kazachstania saulgeensis]